MSGTTYYNTSEVKPSGGNRLPSFPKRPLRCRVILLSPGYLYVTVDPMMVVNCPFLDFDLSSLFLVLALGLGPRYSCIL